MRKIFVKEDCSNEVHLSGDEHLHLSVVLRARIGDEVTLCNGDGYDYIYVIKAIDKKSTALTLIERRVNLSEPKVKAALMVSLLKGDKLDYVCQKLTELGFSDIYPVVTDYTQVKRESVKVERLNKICKEAAQQCGRGKVAVCHSPMTLDEAIAEAKKFDNVLFFYEKDGKSFKEVAANLVGSSAIFVGGEGGWSEEEANKLGFAERINLGKRILRAETACVTAAALIMYESGELK